MSSFFTQPLGLEGQYEVSCHQAQNRGLILFPFIKGNLSAGAFSHASQLQERLHSGLNLMVMCAKPHEMTLCLRDKKLSLRNVVLHIGRKPRQEFLDRDVQYLLE